MLKTIKLLTILLLFCGCKSVEQKRTWLAKNNDGQFANCESWEICDEYREQKNFERLNK